MDWYEEWRLIFDVGRRHSGDVIEEATGQARADVDIHQRGDRWRRWLIRQRLLGNYGGGGGNGWDSGGDGGNGSG